VHCAWGARSFFLSFSAVLDPERTNQQRLFHLNPLSTHRVARPPQAPSHFPRASPAQRYLDWPDRGSLFDSKRPEAYWLAALAKREAALQALERQHAQDLTAEKERLKQAMEDRENTLRELNDEQSKCANKATQLQGQEKRLQNLIGQVKRKDTQIQTLQEIEADRNKLRDAMASTEESLQNKTKQLAQAEASLATVQSFIVKLEPVGSKSAEM